MAPSAPPRRARTAQRCIRRFSGQLNRYADAFVADAALTSDQHHDQDNHQDRAQSAAEIRAAKVESATAEQQQQYDQNHDYVQAGSPDMKNLTYAGIDPEKDWPASHRGDRIGRCVPADRSIAPANSVHSGETAGLRAGSALPRTGGLPSGHNEMTGVRRGRRWITRPDYRTRPPRLATRAGG